MNTKRFGFSVRLVIGSVLILVQAFGAVTPVHAATLTGTITFASDTTWAVSDPAGTFLGFAQDVCLNGTLFCYPTFFGIPGASQIWAPGINGDTLVGPIPAEFFFSKAFILSGPPIAGTISVAVDDFAEVIVNGMSAGTTGSVTDITLAGAAQLCCATFNITPFLVQGTNVITIRAANGPFGCGSGPYSCNPAGLYFGVSLQFLSAETVVIDIKPGSLPNSINPKSKGVIPVAILTTDTFDATTVDPTTILFGPTGTEAAPVHFALEDVDLDGNIDMILHFNNQDTGIVCGDAAASLTGETSSGQTIQGSDSIKTVGCK